MWGGQGEVRTARGMQFCGSEWNVCFSDFFLRLLEFFFQKLQKFKKKIPKKIQKSGPHASTPSWMMFDD